MPRGVPGPVKKTRANTKRPDQIGGGKPGPGRPKGVCNKFTGELKQTILNAVNSAHPEGLHGFIRDTSMETPTAAFALVGRLIPVALDGKVDQTITVVYRDETSA